MKNLKVVIGIILLLAMAACDKQAASNERVSTPTVAPSKAAVTATLPVPTAILTPRGPATATYTARPTLTRTPIPTATQAPVSTIPPTRVSAATRTLAPTVAVQGAYHLAWTWPAQGVDLVEQVAAVNNGMIFVTDTSGTLFALSPGGDEVWSQKISYEGASAPVTSPDGYQVYVAGMPDKVVAFDQKGEILWQYQSDREIVSVPKVSPTGEIYLLERGIEAEVVWMRLSPMGQVLAIEMTDPDRTGRLWDEMVMTRDGNIVLPSDTSIDRYRPDGTQVSSCPVVQNDIAEDILVQPDGGYYIVMKTGELAAYDSDCDELWRYDLLADLAEPGLPGVPVSTPITTGPQGGYTAVQRQDGVILVAGPGALLFAVSGDGKPVWQSNGDPAAGEIVELVVDRRGNLFAFSELGYLQAFDKNGRLVWMEALNPEVSRGPLQPNGGSGILLVQGGVLQNYLGTGR